MKKTLSIFVGIFLVSILFSALHSFAEERITLTTYYPAPYGVYRELRTNNLAVGSSFRNSAFVGTDGHLIVNGSIGIGTASPDIGNGVLLHVLGGRVRSQGAPANDVLEDISSAFELVNRGPGGAPYTWRLYTAAVGGGFGVDANSFEIWEYPQDGTPGCCIPRFRIEDSGPQSVYPGEIYIDEIGRLGINTQQPRERLSVNGGDEMINIMVGGHQAIADNAYYNTTTNSWKYITDSFAQRIYFGNSPGDGIMRLQNAQSGAANADITFSNSISIAPNGNVGINSEPQAGAVLRVAGNDNIVLNPTPPQKYVTINMDHDPYNPNVGGYTGDLQVVDEIWICTD